MTVAGGIAVTPSVIANYKTKYYHGGGPAPERPSAAAASVQFQMQFPELLRADRRRRAGHQIHGLRGFRKRNHVADRGLRAENRHNPIETDRDAPVRRRAVLEGVEEETEAHLRLFVRDLQQPEDESLQLLVVDTNAAARHFAAVEDEIVRSRANPPRLGLEHARVRLERRGERMVHELVALLVLQPFEHREVDDPEKREVVRVEQPFLLRNLQPQLTEQRARRLMAAGRHDQQIGMAASGGVEARPNRLLPRRLQRGALYRALGAASPDQARRAELSGLLHELVQLAA